MSLEEIHVKAFGFLWYNIGSKIEASEAKALRLVCRPWRDIIDKTVTKLSFHGPTVDFGYVAEQWQRWPSVKELRLRCGNHVWDSTHQLADFVTPLLNCKWRKLEQLHFDEVILFNESAEVLATAAAESWPNIRVLNLQLFLFDPTAFSKLGAALWERLEELVLHHEIDDFEEDVEAMEDCRPLAAFLSQCPRLKSLRLSIFQSADSVFNEVMNIYLPYLEHFSLCAKSCTKKLGEIIASKASHWPSLKVFEFSIEYPEDASPYGDHSHLQSECLRAFIGLCEANFPLLETLDLHECFDGARINAEAFNALRTAMERRWHKMKYLYLGDVVGAAFAEFLQGTYPFLETINYHVLSQEQDRSAVIRAFADAGQRNRLPSLKFLDFSICRQEEAQAVQAVLSNPWPKVEKLEIRSWIPCWDSICTSLREAVKSNYLPCVKELEIRDIFDRIPTSLLIKAFQHPWPSVEHLKIDLCNLTGPALDAAVTNLFNLKEIRNNKPWVTAPLALEAFLNAPLPKLTTISNVQLEDMPEESELCKSVADRWEFRLDYNKNGDFHRLHR